MTMTTVEPPADAATTQRRETKMSAITKLASKAAGIDLDELDLPALAALVTTMPAMQADIAELRDLMQRLVAIEDARAKADGIVIPVDRSVRRIRG
jgi:hypothetical protein